MKIVYTGINGALFGIPTPELNAEYILALDASASRSGICVLRLSGELGFVCAVSRQSESIIEYKLALQEFIRKIIKTYKIRQTAYEEPFIGYANTAAGLYAVATILQEISVEINGVSAIGVSNTKWKSKFIGKLQGNRTVQKALVREKAIETVPALAECKDDETDAYGLAVYFVGSIAMGTQIESETKPRRFAFTVNLYGGSPDLSELYIPKRKDGVIEQDISACRQFDATVYKLLNNKDSVLVLRFPAGKFGAAILCYDINNAARDNTTLTAVVMRKNKKKK